MGDQLSWLERLPCTQEVIGSTPIFSTIFPKQLGSHLIYKVYVHYILKQSFSHSMGLRHFTFGQKDYRFDSDILNDSLDTRIDRLQNNQGYYTVNQFLFSSVLYCLTRKTFIDILMLRIREKQIKVKVFVCYLQYMKQIEYSLKSKKVQ